MRLELVQGQCREEVLLLAEKGKGGSRVELVLVITLDKTMREIKFQSVQTFARDNGTVIA